MANPSALPAASPSATMHGTYLCTVNDEDGCGEILHFWAQPQPNGEHRAGVYMEETPGSFFECEEMDDLDNDGEWFIFEGDLNGCLGFIGVFYWGEYQDPRFAGKQVAA